MKKAIVFCLALTLCSLAQAADYEIVRGDLEQAFSDESFLATVDMLENLDVKVDLSPKAVTFFPDADIFFEDFGPVMAAISFPLRGGDNEQLVYVFTEDGNNKVVVIGSSLRDFPDLAAEPKVLCGSYLYSNTCNYGPWLSGQGCPGGPLYEYHNRTRKFYENGRKVSLNYKWYKCEWEAQDATCQSNCW